MQNKSPVINLIIRFQLEHNLLFIFTYSIVSLVGLCAQFLCSLCVSTDLNASQKANFPIKEDKVLKWNLKIVIEH